VTPVWLDIPDDGAGEPESGERPAIAMTVPKLVQEGNEEA